MLLVRLLNRPTLYIQCAIILPFFIFSNTPRLGHYMCASLVNGEFYLNNDEDKPKKIDIKYVEEIINNSFFQSISVFMYLF